MQAVDSDGVIVATSESTSLTVANSPTMTATIVEEEELVTNEATPTPETAESVEPTEADESTETGSPTQTDSSSVEGESTEAGETTSTTSSSVEVEPTEAGETTSTTSTSVEGESTEAGETTETDSESVEGESTEAGEAGETSETDSESVEGESTEAVETTETDSESVEGSPTEAGETSETDSESVEGESTEAGETSPAIEPTESAPPSVEEPVLSLSTKNLTVSGKGEPGLQVQILIDGQLVGETTIGSDGEWVFTTEINEGGEHQASIQLLDQNNQLVGTSGPISFFVTLPASPSSEIVCESIYLVLADEWLTGIALRYWNNAYLYPAIVTATNQKHVADDTFATITDADFVKPGWKLCLVDEATARELIQKRQ